VVSYDSRWPTDYRRIADEVDRALVAVSHTTEHIGSTAVPGLAAKPIIDLFAVVESLGQLCDAISALGGAGWKHEGDGGLAGRERFISRTDLPYHHLYVVVRGNRQYQVQTRFRDILRTDPVARDEYAQLKLSLASVLAMDRAAYTEGKSALISDLLMRYHAP
jgi:GrpB-like predicted nucleotidyltransferase (UPF0157 family)